MIDYIYACCAIETAKEEGKRNIISFYLRKVANELGKDVANSLILKYNLWYGTNGSHKWFDDKETMGQYQSIKNPFTLDLNFEENWFYSNKPIME